MFVNAARLSGQHAAVLSMLRLPRLPSGQKGVGVVMVGGVRCTSGQRGLQHWGRVRKGDQGCGASTWYYPSAVGISMCSVLVAGVWVEGTG